MKRFILKIRNFIAVIIIAFPSFSFIAMQPVAAFSVGDGSLSNPFEIQSCSDLFDVNNDLTKSYNLMEDLDCTTDGNDILIGSQSTGFSGIFNGNLHTISINIDTGENDQSGLFRRTDSGAQIINVIVEGTVNGNIDTGGLVGLANGTSIVGAQINVNVTGERLVGGIVGNSNETTISYSTSTGSVQSNTTFAGGAVGRGYSGNIDTTTASGMVTGQDYTGGLIGYSEDCDVIYSSASGIVEGNDGVGGLLGSGAYSSNDQNIIHSHATGSVTGRYSVGGLVGELPNGEISKSYSTGNVSAPSGDDAGGLVGRGVLGTSLEISNSFTTGDVSAAGDVGGVIGYGNVTAHVTNVYATGTLTTASPFGVGGIIGGGTPAPIANSFWDTTTTNATSACYDPVQAENCGGTGLNTTLMKNSQSFIDADWDFDTVWSIDSEINDGYPYLISRPQMTCEFARMTSTTGRVACDILYERAPSNPLNTTWQARYRESSSSDWINVDITNPALGLMIFHNLNPATEYELSLKPTNALIDDWGIIIGISLDANSDVDSDGILDSVENNSPNLGDSNGDGVLDAEQGAITTVSNSVSDNYTSIASDCTSNSNVSINAESSTYKDAGYNYDAGLLNFTSTGCGPLATFTQYFYGSYDPANTIARKYNSITHSYTNLEATLTSVTIGGQKALKIVYSIADNSNLDEDTTTGIIKDPSGPAVLAAGVPNTGLGNVQ